ncbi:IclR family transcriptional regulator [Amycolatopsis acidiphila]|uniref:IclR family transcriptional regulator n=1 Tax=Amycolatopsis acidiphila TaxID=715473 RepID=A0A558ABU1_9PSEU|nr:IclR family transcriptional regulator [Amycolatopsis acidiphila]TVT21695.1 IclR family transcriptional regulator [Amycolatopsis acidiphila]UIJ59765.1 IclR family transcriptional regulator [Amycolatopsis acidiphila]GHG98430.1 IclR family transcriptional regulator [Amycolatopsis acidiphila]
MRSTQRHDGNGTSAAPSVLDRVLAILGAFDGESRPLGTSELARRTGLAKSTVHRLVCALVTHGLLERHGDGVVLGLRLFELAERVPRQHDLREAALPYMADLRAATRQTVHLAVLDGTEVVYVEILRSRDAPPLPSRVGGRLPAHATGVGKAILAFSPSETVEAVIRGGLPRLSERTIAGPGLLQRELRAVRGNGIAYDHEESRAGLVCAASPITAADGTIAGALSVSGWVGRLNVRRIAPAVRTAALALSRDLGAPTQ